MPPSRTQVDPAVTWIVESLGDRPLGQLATRVLGESFAPRQKLVWTLLRDERLDLETVLTHLDLPELKELCRRIGADDRGMDPDVLRDRVRPELRGTVEEQTPRAYEAGPSSRVSAVLVRSESRWSQLCRVRALAA